MFSFAYYDYQIMVSFLKAIIFCHSFIQIEIILMLFRFNYLKAYTIFFIKLKYNSYSIIISFDHGFL